MSIHINGSYLNGLKRAQPNTIFLKHKNPILAALGKKTPTVIPPINTDIQFSKVLPAFSLSKHRGLSAISSSILPENFDWGHPNVGDTPEITRKKTLITKPGNQAICGSCWAISTAGIVADNFVISGIVDWKPELSTTWCLSNYPQGQCNGGNPALLFEDIARGGIATKHCIDYSWCLENDVCNGSALKHFDAQTQTQAISELNSKIPDGGCYYGDSHYLYYINPNSKSMFIGSDGINERNIADLVKKQIYVNGTVLGGFLVYNNFIPGLFSNSNQGVYLERGIYTSSGDPTFSDEQTTAPFYKGSHAVAIVGWGIAKNILVDNNNKRADVPYWYCRNSWKDTWAEGGYFKMAMYPWNKISQFDKQIIIEDQTGQQHLGGGIIFVSATKAPVKTKIKDVSPQYKNMSKLENESFYKTDPIQKITPKKNSNPDGSNPDESPKSINIYVIIAIILTVILLIIGVFYSFHLRLH
jgi:hypothetical protein